MNELFQMASELEDGLADDSAPRSYTAEPVFPPVSGTGRLLSQEGCFYLE